jgi:aspartate racemase
MRRVGILGGMGPEATVLLMQKLIAAVPARDDADHIPLLVDQNPQIPSRIRFLFEGQGQDPGPIIAAMASRLQSHGAEAIAMPCNTAHHFAPLIRDAVTVPFLDMIGLSVDHAASLAEPGGKVGILASPAVRRIGLLDRLLTSRGLQPVWPADDDAMLAIIRRIKSQGPDAHSMAALTAASAELAATGATVQMIACTEFSLIAQSIAPGVTAFDTLDCLVSAIVEFSTSKL